MTESQANAALIATLEVEVTRLRAVNAELRASIQTPVQPDTGPSDYIKIHDAVVADSDKAYALLRWAETEMRYANWDKRVADNHGRADVYEAILEFLK